MTATSSSAVASASISFASVHRIGVSSRDFAAARKSCQAVIVGWQVRANSPTVVRAFIMAIPDANGRWDYVGAVEAGLTPQLNAGLLEKLRPARLSTSPLTGRGPRNGARNITWVVPELVCNLTYAEVEPITAVLVRPRWDSLCDGVSAEAVTVDDLRARATRLDEPTPPLPVADGTGSVTDVAPDIAELGERLLECGFRLSRQVQNELGQHHLSISRVQVLDVLIKEGPMRQNALSRRRRVAPRTVTALIDALERDGFVRRANDPTNRTAHLLTVTQRGVQAHARVQHARHEAWRAALSSLTAREQIWLRAIIERFDADSGPAVEAGQS